MRIILDSGTPQGTYRVVSGHDEHCIADGYVGQIFRLQENDIVAMYGVFVPYFLKFPYGTILEQVSEPTKFNALKNLHTLMNGNVQFE